MIRKSTMSQAELLRNSIIDKLLVINDINYLKAIYQIILPIDGQVLILSKEQKILLEQSLKEVEEGKVISQSDLELEQAKWLKEK